MQQRNKAAAAPFRLQHAPLPVRPMSATIILARHAHHDEIGRVLSGRSAIALSAPGREQASRLADKLAARGVRAIHSSPRPRTLETARPTAERLGLRITEAASMDEIDFGDWTGRSFVDLSGEGAWQQWNADRATVRPPGGETIAEAVARTSSYLETLLSGPAPVVVFTHADVVRALAVHYLAAPMQKMLSTRVDPASLTELAFDGAGGVTLVALNERLQ